MKLSNLNKHHLSPLLYLITDRQQYAHPQQQLEAIAAAAQAGCQLIQIREKDLTPQELCEFTRAAITRAKPFGAHVMVNDRLDVALVTGADGVHLRTNSLSAAEVRRVVQRRNFLIGVSTHSIEEATAAEASGADFLVCGPVFPTPTKAAFGAPLGLHRLAEICRQINVPVLALGGISMTNFTEPLAHEAAGLAAIGLFKNTPSLGSNIKIVLSSRLNPQD